jgi:hypothetical protein
VTHESSRSQGKGNRRWPGRPGGARKRKRQEWAKRATHMVESLEDLPQPTMTRSFSTIWGKTPAEVVYLLDQEMAKAAIPYFAEMSGGRRSYVFTIAVAQDAAANVQRIIDQLRPPTGRVRPARFRGWWTDIEPARLSRAYQDHPWVFAVHRESASDRDDGQKYVAFLFRNKERTVFGYAPGESRCP